MTDRIRDAAGGLKDRVTELADGARDRLGESREPAFDGGHTHTGHTRSTVYGDISYAGSQDGDGLALRDRATELRQGADRQMQHAREKVQEGSRRMSHGFQRAVEDYPLALGAVTFGLGWAAGLGIPTSERENALMGDAADTLKDEVRRTARTAADAARDVAGEAGRTVREEPDWQEPPGI